jgi:hypothetical protein
MKFPSIYGKTFQTTRIPKSKIMSVVKIELHTQFPGDEILVGSLSHNWKCFIDTSAFDWESSLKEKYIVKDFNLKSN